MEKDQAVALAELLRASEAHRAARDGRDAAILAARASGATYRAIATEARLALSRIHAIAGPVRT